MLEEVRKLYARGFSLLPLVGKRAALLEWESLQKNRASLETVESWFKNGDRNVAIVTGKISGIVCLDIDPKHGGNVAKYLDRFPTDCYVLTGGGGAHLYYRYPNHEVHNIQVEGKAVQWKGDGGYVVAPPSIHPDTKKVYRWVNDGEPAPFPEALYKESSELEEKGENWVSSLLAFGASDGERNNSLTSITGYLASINVPQDIALEIAKNWNLRNPVRLNLDEIETTVKSVYKTAKRRLTLEPVKVEENGDFVGPKSFRLQTFDDYMRTYADTPIDWIIPGWLPDNTISFVVSPPGSFKTWLLLDLAVSIAMGGKFLGLFPVKMEGPVILIQQEDWAGQTAQRIEVIRQSKTQEILVDNADNISLDLPKSIPLFIHTDRKLKFDNLESLKGLAENIEKIRPKIVILDPLYSAASTDDYMASSIEQMFYLKELRDKFGCTFIIAHHTNKGTAEGRMRAWGSQFLNAFLETGWQLFPKGERSIKVVRHFKSANNPPETCLSFAIDTDKGFTYSVAEGLVDAENKSEEETTLGETIEADDEDFRHEPSASMMDEMDARANQPGKGKSKVTAEIIAKFFIDKQGWLAARQVADHFDFDLGVTTKKLDNLVKKGILMIKEDPRRRPGWKKSYKMKY